ncbi:MFS transporter [Anabaena cylindrica UHCC 0172]|uniref:MFS transporter n=1 Tax=Anabaena cylindrica TaxID=1165 RepID=UPI002B201D14|nr:MFS transporter [Anabaena cylindrica]MEA5549577.1 MFS transporter [Anabaena cylindrica UHCC 0172]
MQTFTFIWLGQLISLIGVSMTGFALDISIFQETRSATQFAFLTIACTIPIIIVSPITGTLVDRWDRRWIMIISNACQGLLTLMLIALISIGQLEIWHVYLRNILTSIIGAFHASAYQASITTLVPQEDLPRVNGIIQLGMGIQQLIGPLLGGILLSILQPKGILIINFITLLIAIFPLLLVRFPQLNEADDENKNNPPSSFWQETLGGWTYLTENPGLLSFVILFTIYKFFIGLMSVLSFPLILSLTSPSGLGQIVFVSGMGMLVSSIIMSTWKKNWQNLINPILISMSLSGLCIILAGLRPSIIQIAIATLLFFLTTPFISGLVQVILQTTVPESLQGRVFALTGSIWVTVVPLAAIIAGPLADYVFEPLMSFDGPGAELLLGQIIGSGPGRGIGLLFVIIGSLLLATVFISSQYPAIRDLEVSTQ